MLGPLMRISYLPCDGTSLTSTPGGGTPMLLASSLAQVREMAYGAVSVEPRPVRNSTSSPHVSRESTLYSSNTCCATPAPANHSAFRSLKKVLLRRESDFK